jgi:shikimate kinase
MDGGPSAVPARPPRPGGRHLVLVGSMGVGKSTVGRLLAERLGRPLRDSDADLAAAQHRSGRTVAAERGVDELHRWEADHLLDALGRPEPSVIAAAASTIDDDRCLRALQDADVVWLRASPGTLAHRIARQSHRRDLGDDPAATLAHLERSRASRYAQVAHLTLDVDDITPEQTVDAVLSAGWEWVVSSGRRG